MKVQKYKIESFEWVRIPEDLPRENLVMAITKTAHPTIHPSDAEHPIRLFKTEELLESARSLAKRYIGLNHIRLPDGSPVLIEFSPEEAKQFGSRYAFTVDSNYNPLTKCVESLLLLPKFWVNKIRRGIVNQVSVEYTWRDETKTESGTEFIGLIFDKVDLLEGINAGDTHTELRCVEGKKGTIDGDLFIPQCKDCKHEGTECQMCKEHSPETDIKQDEIDDSIDDDDTTFFEECQESADSYLKRLGEPLSPSFQKVHDKMVAQYGPEKGKQVYYAWVNKQGYDDTKAFPKKKKEGSDIAVVNDEHELIPLPKDKEKDGKLVFNEVPKDSIKEIEAAVGQIPEQPVNSMANEPTPLTAIFPEKLVQEPEKTVTIAGAVVDRSPESNEVIIMTQEDKSKQAVESADPKKEDKKKGESLPSIPSTPQTPAPPLPTQPETPERPLPTEPIVAATPTITVVNATPSNNASVAQVPIVMTPETQKLIESQATKIKEQDVALVKLQTSVREAESTKRKAVEEAKLAIIRRVESVLPDQSKVSQWSRGGQILATEVRKVIYEEKKKKKE